MTAPLETLSQQRCFEGVQGFYRHPSAVTGGPMRFSVFLPERASHSHSPCPALYYLAGLECTEQTFVIKAGAQRVAAALGLALVTCDTSPRAARDYTQRSWRGHCLSSVNTHAGISRYACCELLFDDNRSTLTGKL
jgi:S-formylglutathione hydrolase FrmB